MYTEPSKHRTVIHEVNFIGLTIFEANEKQLALCNEFPKHHVRKIVSKDLTTFQVLCNCIDCQLAELQEEALEEV